MRFRKRWAAALPGELRVGSLGEVRSQGKWADEIDNHTNLMNPEQAKEYLRLIIPEAAKELVKFVAPELDEISARISSYGLASGRRKALGIVTQMGAELIAGAAQLFESERWYAGAALVRQLIEVEYLLYLFASDPAEADLWLSSSPGEVKKMFSPGKMRERTDGQFDADEYSTHCEFGGHPRLKGSVLLRERMTPIRAEGEAVELFSPSALWVDLSQHIERLWKNFSRAVQVISPSNFYPERFEEIESRLAEWRRKDPFPEQI